MLIVIVILITLGLIGSYATLKSDQTPSEHTWIDRGGNRFH
jgi:hypothetical protein